MPIGPFTMIAIYVTVWWTVLFAILPIGMNQRDQARPTDGGQWGAPDDPRLKRKFITTTWVAALVWLLIMVLVYIGWMPLPDLAPPV